MTNKTRAISEGAMMIAIIGVVLLLNRQFTNFFEVLLYFISIPIIVYSVRYSFQMAIIVSVSTFLVGFIFSSLTTWVYIGFALGGGLLYAYGLEKKWKNGYLLTGQIGLNFLSTFITVIVFASLFGYSIEEEVAMMQSILPIHEGLQQYLVMCVLLSYIGIALLQAIVIHVSSQMVLKRLGLPHRTLKAMHEIHMPKVCAYVCVASGVLYGIGMYATWSATLQQSILFLLSTSSMLCMVNGVFALLSRIQQKNGITICAIFIACFIPIIKEGLVIIGIYDMFHSIRIRKKVSL